MGIFLQKGGTPTVITRLLSTSQYAGGIFQVSKGMTFILLSVDILLGNPLWHFQAHLHSLGSYFTPLYCYSCKYTNKIFSSICKLKFA